jgi:hypothetical protein
MTKYANLKNRYGRAVRTLSTSSSHSIPIRMCLPTPPEWKPLALPLLPPVVFLESLPLPLPVAVLPLRPPALRPTEDQIAATRRRQWIASLKG